MPNERGGDWVIMTEYLFVLVGGEYVAKPRHVVRLMNFPPPSEAPSA